MIGFVRFIAIIGVAITSFLTRREFKKMADKEQNNDDITE